MHVRYFGDSYDIVKQSLLRWLAPLGPWAAHPIVFAAEVNEILGGRPDSLVLVFDQSLQRGREAEGLAGKLEALAGAGIRGFAYRSHAAFLLLGLEERSVRAARDLLLRESRLPASRLVAGP